MASSTSTSYGMHETDPKALVLEYIRSLALDPHGTVYKLFRLRNQATAKEVAIMHRHYAVALHPDKERLDQWLQSRGCNNHSFLVQARNELALFYNFFLQEMDKLADFDEQLHKQPSCGMVGDIDLPSAVCIRTYSAANGRQSDLAHSDYTCNLSMLNVYLVAGLH